MGKGLFITFEGPDGGGKTTQIERLRVRLEQAGHDIVKTREIGGTPEAEKIRDLIVRQSGGDWLPLSMMLLIAVARYEHTVRLIKPALEGGKTVLSDRYADSTYVYQVAAGQGTQKDYDEIYALTLGAFKPDLTFILDVDGQTAITRTGKSVQANVSREEKADDRFEARGSSFQDKVRQAYLDIADREPTRCYVIDATQSVDKVAQDVWKIVEQKVTPR